MWFGRPTSRVRLKSSGSKSGRFQKRPSFRAASLILIRFNALCRSSIRLLRLRSCSPTIDTAFISPSRAAFDRARFKIDLGVADRRWRWGGGTTDGLLNNHGWEAISGVADFAHDRHLWPQISAGKPNNVTMPRRAASSARQRQIPALSDTELVLRSMKMKVRASTKPAGKGDHRRVFGPRRQPIPKG